MLKALIIRQLFLVADVTLALAVTALSYMVLTKVFEADTQEYLAASPTAASDNSVIFAKVEARTEYDDLVQSRLFGSAGQRSKANEASVPVPEIPVERSADDLHLRLWGTVAAAPTDPLATAVIENGSFRTTDTYYLGEAIMDRIKLIEVYKRKVILFNEATNERLFLQMEEEAPPPQIRMAAQPPRPARSRPAQVERQPSSRITVDTQELNELAEDYGALVAQINPRLYMDESGNVAGITGDNLGSMPLASKLGLQDGDVIQTVNGIAIDSQEKVFEIITKFRGLDTFRVGILRDGSPQMITFKLE